MTRIPRLAGDGWLALLGGGELTFGETLEADTAWVEKAPEGSVAFIPAASGSADYGRHFAEYMDAEFGRTAETVPIYRDRDARRGKNAERIAAAAAVYLGGGVADHLLEALGTGRAAGEGGEGSPALDAILARLRSGGVVVAIAAAAQALGAVARSVAPGRHLTGLGWLPGGVVEPNFDPGHDRRLRKLLERPGVGWGLGIAAGSAVLLGPGGAVEVTGDAWYAAGPSDEIHPLR